MNQNHMSIQKRIKKAEEEAFFRQDNFYRTGFHIMPPTGWLNDPNGLCQMGDTYHLFFQYAPFDTGGGMKVWGHYMTKDFCRFTYAGAPFVPDMPFDKDGVYSGSACTDEEGMHIFYTGNVKLSGEHDYISSGRRADVILVDSRDGLRFGEKKVVIDTDNFPDTYSCHIRDPKVWKKKQKYYMVLGGRTKEAEGRVLVYTSADRENWNFHKEIYADKPFGYMWECPDLFEISGQYVLSVSPQGLEKKEFVYQNIYQSGYFLSKEDLAEKESQVFADDFREWDMGFDFYAPQTFEDKKGRRILIGWAGLPDAAYKNAEAEKENWQHCLTVPRVLTLKQKEDGSCFICQNPIEELRSLRKGSPIVIQKKLVCLKEEYLDIECENLPKQFEITIAGGVKFAYDGREIALTLAKDTGLGRDIRKAEISEITSLRILIDSSILEYYINDGEMVFTTRYYKKNRGTMIQADCKPADIIAYPMENVEVKQWGN